MRSLDPKSFVKLSMEEDIFVFNVFSSSCNVNRECAGKFGFLGLQLKVKKRKKIFFIQLAEISANGEGLDSIISILQTVHPQDSYHEMCLLLH